MNFLIPKREPAGFPVTISHSFFNSGHDSRETTSWFDSLRDLRSKIFQREVKTILLGVPGGFPEHVIPEAEVRRSESTAAALKRKIGGIES